MHDTALDLVAAKRERDIRCPRRGGEWVNSRTGELLPSACWASSCPRCYAVQVARKRIAVAHANPQWLLTATQVGHAWEDVLRAFRALMRRLRADGMRPEMAWTVECAARGESHHMHGLDWGPMPTAMRLREHCVAVGWGRETDLRTVASTSVSGYLMKQAVNAGGQLEHYLSMNGRRLLHTTARFWRDPDGSPIRGGLRVVLERAEACR